MWTTALLCRGRQATSFIRFSDEATTPRTPMSKRRLEQIYALNHARLDVQSAVAGKKQNDRTDTRLRTESTTSRSPASLLSTMNAHLTCQGRGRRCTLFKLRDPQKAKKTKIPGEGNLMYRAETLGLGSPLCRRFPPPSPDLGFSLGGPASPYSLWEVDPGERLVDFQLNRRAKASKTSGRRGRAADAEHVSVVPLGWESGIVRT